RHYTRVQGLAQIAVVDAGAPYWGVARTRLVLMLCLNMTHPGTLYGDSSICCDWSRGTEFAQLCQPNSTEFRHKAARQFAFCSLLFILGGPRPSSRGLIVRDDLATANNLFTGSFR